MRRAVEDGEGKAEESAQGSQASADSFCRVMGLLGMGHRLFVPRLLAVRGGGGGGVAGAGKSCGIKENRHVWMLGLEL